MKKFIKIFALVALFSLQSAYAAEPPKQNPFTNLNTPSKSVTPNKPVVPMPTNMTLPSLVNLEKGSVEFKDQFIEIKVIDGRVQSGTKVIIVKNGEITSGETTADFVSTTKGNIRYQLKSGNLNANLKDGSNLSINVMDLKMMPPGMPTANFQAIRVIQNKTITERKPLTIE